MVEGEEGCQARDWVLLQTCWHAEGWHVLHGHASMHLHVDAGVQMCWHEMQMVADADGGHWRVGVLACRHGWWWMQMVVDVDETRMSVSKKENLLGGMDADGGGCGCVTANVDVVVHGGEKKNLPVLWACRH